MSLFSLSQAQDVKVGNDAGWAIEFYGVDASGKLGKTPAKTLRSSDYYASIDASLSDDFNGGNYSFTIEGLTDADYKAIAKGDGGAPPIAAKLYLFWNDAIDSPAAYLKNLVGISGAPASDLKDALVAVLHVSQPKRKLGSLTYDTEIHAQEWAFFALNKRLVKPLQADTYPDVAKEITNRTNVTINTYPAGAQRLTTDAAGTPGGETVAYGTGTTYAGILSDIAGATEKNLNKFGRHMTLIRDGEIHLGPRSFPLNGDAKDLTVSSGLLEALPDGSDDQDPTAPDLSGGSQRRHFTVTLKGRPDIKPGDIVRFEPAQEDDSTTTPGLGSALLGALAGPLLPAIGGALGGSAISLAVTSVKHRMGKATGFSTEVRGVELKDPADPWDSYSDKGASRKPQVASPKADAGANAADAIMNYVDSWSSGQFTIDVAQVRSFSSQSGDKTPSQTEVIWEGLQEVDRNANGTRRLPVDQRNTVRLDIPYASPFAWGKCGLVVPRYPGMRVAVAHRRGMEHEPIDVGAVWDSGTGPDSEAGDWWLSLPVGVDESKRDKASDSDTPAAWSGAVAQDLIDADGNRMIELGSLVVRIGKDKLSNAGTRPKSPDEEGVISIEHVSGGAQIVMKQDGSILLQGKSISIDAGQGDVTISGNNVNVNVSQAMNVK